ncbi:hypothetical protein ACQPW3_21210 [Actinosynnema sp. CA-248983]
MTPAVEHPLLPAPARLPDSFVRAARIVVLAHETGRGEHPTSPEYTANLTRHARLALTDELRRLGWTPPGPDWPGPDHPDAA